MTEVVAKLKFITPCLGNKRRENKPNEMLRDPQGNVIFLSSWWNTILSYGARAFSKHQSQVKKIGWDQVVDGVTGVYRRYYTDVDYTEHEAFLAGSVIGVRALLPDTIPLEDFQCILEISGRYRGISPYGHDKGFGRFEVVEVSKSR